MTPRSGERTGEFGCWLTRYLAGTSGYRDYIVYYDHGDKQSEPNVAVIHGFYGTEVTNVTRLAELDVMVVSPRGEVVVLIEIEEGAIPPKRLLGDLLAILMCNGFAVKTDIGHGYFTITPDTQFILAGVVSSRGSKPRKIQEVIVPRLGDIGQLSGGIDPRNVSLVFESNIQTAIGVVKDRVRGMFAVE